MKRWLKWTLLIVSVAALLGCAFVAYVSWRSADSLIHPEREVLAFDPSSVGLAFENVSFNATDGVALSGWWIPETVPGHNGTVVFLHGYAESLNQSLLVAPFLAAHAYDVLAFDFRAHGRSGGDYTTVGLVEVDDVRGAVDYLLSRGDVDASRIALLGFSMGAATAINAAPRVPEARAIVADSSFATLTNIASNSITAFTGLPRWPYGPLAVLFAGWMVGRDVGDNRPVEVIRSVERPVMIIQGLADTIAYPDDDGRALAAAAPRGELWLVPGATHVDAVTQFPAEYEARVLAFLAAHVAPDP